MRLYFRGADGYRTRPPHGVVEEFKRYDFRKYHACRHHDNKLYHNFKQASAGACSFGHSLSCKKLNTLVPAKVVSCILRVPASRVSAQRSIFVRFRVLRLLYGYKKECLKLSLHVPLLQTFSKITKPVGFFCKISCN